MARYPWSVLGIPKTNDERAIKSAYAKKIKLTRPEDDAAAFQELVEARNLAINLIGTHQPKAPRGARKKPKTEPVSQPPTIEVQSIIPQLIEDAPVDVNTPLEAKPALQENTAEDASRSDLIDAAISSFLDTSALPEQFETASAAIDELIDGNLILKAELEPLLLRSVVDWLAEQDNEVREGTIQITRAKLSNLQKQIVVRLDVTFGWSEDFKRLSMLVPFADQLTDELVYLRHRNRPETMKKDWRLTLGAIFIWIPFGLYFLFNLGLEIFWDFYSLFFSF